MKKLIPTLVCLFALFAFTGCSEDEDEYQSRVPSFSGIEFDYETLYTDQEVTATAVQYSKGRLLNYTTYEWSSNVPSDSTLHSNMSGVIYDNNSANPTCTFKTPSVAGSYQIVMHAEYGVSGKASNSTETREIQSGTVTYQYTPLKGYVTITQRFTVRKRP